MNATVRRLAVATGLALILPVFLLVLWEVASQQEWINPIFYPAPSDVLDRVWLRLKDGTIAKDSRITTGRLLAGFVIGAAPGLVLGLISGLVRSVRNLTYPLATALYVVPRIALLPLVLVALGINDQARIFMVAFSVFFIVYFSALSGVQQVDQGHIDTARAFGARRVRLATTVLLPATAPAIFNGLRVSLGFALIVIVGTEFLAANDGLGALIWTSYQIFDFPSMYAGIVAVTVLGVLLSWVLVVAEWAALPWRR